MRTEGEVMRFTMFFILSVCVVGCVGSGSFFDEPIIDRKGVDMAKYAIDKAECQQYAEEVKQGEKVARGVIGGAVVGGAIGAIVNRSSNSAERGAGVGAVTGGVRGTQEGIREQERVVKQCLRGRGYRVLN